MVKRLRRKHSKNRGKATVATRVRAALANKLDKKARVEMQKILEEKEAEEELEEDEEVTSEDVLSDSPD